MPTVPGTVIASIPAGGASATQGGAANQASTSTDNVVFWRGSTTPPLVLRGEIDSDALGTTWPAWRNYPHPTADVVYYTVGDEDKFAVVDVSDRSNPVLVQVITTPLDNIRPLRATSTHLFIHRWGGGALSDIMVYDLADPLDPVYVSTNALPMAGPGGVGFFEFMEFSIDGQHLFLSGWGADGPFASVDISDPDNPVLADSIVSATLNGAGQFALTATTAFVPCIGSDTIVIIDIADPANVSIIDTELLTDPDLRRPYAVVRNGDYLYVATWGDNIPTTVLPAMSVWQITGETTITQVGKLTVPEDEYDDYPLFAEELCNIGSFVFFATSANDPWISCVDAYDPTNPVLYQVIGPESGSINSTLGISTKGTSIYVTNANANSTGETVFAVLSFGSTPATPSSPVTAGLLLETIASETSTITVAGQVTAWADRSGNGNHLVTSSSPGTGGPTSGSRTINGRNVLDFDGVNDGLDFPAAVATALSAAGEGEIFIVLELDDETPPGDAESASPIQGMSGASQYSHYPYSDNNVYMAWGSTSRKSCGNPPASLQSPHILNMWSGLPSWGIVINADTLISTLTNTADFIGGPTDFSVTPGAYLGHLDGTDAYGSGGTGVFYNGAIAHIIIFDRILDHVERIRVRAYLADWWGITT